MEMYQAIKKELEKQLEARGLSFAGVDNLEDFADEIEDAADYILEAYTDVEQVSEKIEYWIEETQANKPGFLIQN